MEKTTKPRDAVTPVPPCSHSSLLYRGPSSVVERQLPKLQYDPNKLARYL